MILPKVYESLYDHFRKRGDYKTALQYHEELEQALDQIEIRTAAVDLAEAETQMNKLIQQKELEFEQSKRERITLIAISVGLLLLITLVFGGIVFRKNQNLKKVNQLIQAQKTEIQKQNDALEQALERAESSVLAKSQFLSRMSHEIRTPMNAIVGLTDVILQEQELKGEARKNANAIAESAEHLLSLINEVLEFSQMESKEYQVVPKAFNLSRLIQNIRETTAHRAASQGNEWEVELDPQTARVVYGR